MHYEEQGLFLGLISYPFSIDGKELYKKLQSIFYSHKENLKKHSNESDPVDNQLYAPVAYRMFGTHGLAVLSLVDDYAFCSRIFNPNHIKLSKTDKSINNMKNMFQSVVITGASETEDEAFSLRKKAEDTFLRKDDMFPFIGIIRLKIDYRLLQNKGCETIRAIRRWIMQEHRDSPIHRYISINKIELDYLIVDCFDNDELVVVAFSDKIGVLYEFLDRIRQMNCNDAGIAHDSTISEKHIFASCHLSFGYHIDYDVTTKSGNNNSTFLDIYDEKMANNDGDSDTKKEKDENRLMINCLCETKPGHRVYFCEYIKDKFGVDVFRRTMTGGTIVHVELPFTKIHDMERLCRLENEGFQQHLRRIKITLNDPREIKPTRCEHEPGNKFTATSIVSEDYISDIENIVKRFGISKIVREKLLSLFRLYNDCCNNHLQFLYFEELNPALTRILRILEELEIEADIRKMEEILNAEIAALEEAFYYRMHNSKTPNTTLEYGGGVQQHLTAFNYAYKQLVGLLSPWDSSMVYARITSAERVSSTRTHLDLNINHIMYPELFATTAWKEAANFTSGILHELKTTRSFQTVELMNIWNSFIENPHSYKQLQYELFVSTEFQNDDPVFQVLKEILNDVQVLKYLVNDYIVYHMAFQRDYEMMWHFYLKIMLQTTNCYHRLNKIKRAHVVYMLFRLLMIAFRETGSRQKQIRDFLEQQKTNPYDYLLAEIWCDSFSKIEEGAKTIFAILDNYGFREVSEYLTLFSETQIIGARNIKNNRCTIRTSYLHDALQKLENADMMKQLETCLETRKEQIALMCESFSRYELIEPSDQHVNNGQISPDFIVCMLFAYLKQIYILDGMDKSAPVLKSVPRSNNGEIDAEILGDMERGLTSLHILADPTSGFLITPQSVRNRYFALRTTLYRSLWNYRMKGPKIQ